MIENIDAVDNLVLLINNLTDERLKRTLLGAVSDIYGFGGATRIHELTGMSLTTIRRGKVESTEATDEDSGRIRRPGGGRKPVEEHYPDIEEHIEKIIDGHSYGDPEKPLHWVSRSLTLRKISDILKNDFNEIISYVKVDQLLSKLGYSKQVNQKKEQVGIGSPHRDEQFQFINDTAAMFLRNNNPVISVDTKKKENLGNFKNNGAEYRKINDPRIVNDHDFLIKELGKVSPYGVYLLNTNTGFVNLGTDHDTSEFAVESIRRWWNILGKNTFPKTKKLYITCDGGGSNGFRNRLWKSELQKLANETGLQITVSHYPPGTSKWNKIEHRRCKEGDPGSIRCWKASYQRRCKS